MSCIIKIFVGRAVAEVAQFRSSAQSRDCVPGVAQMLYMVAYVCLSYESIAGLPTRFSPLVSPPGSLFLNITLLS